MQAFVDLAAPVKKPNCLNETSKLNCLNDFILLLRYFLYAFLCFVLFVRVKSYRKKNNKKVKTGLMTSFILLLTEELRKVNPSNVI